MCCGFGMSETRICSELAMRPSPTHRLPAAVLLNLLHDRAVLYPDASGTFGEVDVRLRVRVSHESIAIFLIAGQVLEIDQRQRKIGGSRDLCRKVIADKLAATAPYRFGPGARVFLEVRQLVHIDGIADAERDHLEPPNCQHISLKWRDASTAIEMSCPCLS